VLVPRWAGAMVVARTLFQLVSERQTGDKSMAEFERVAAEELAEMGAEQVAQPVGPGGRAAAEAARRRATV
nr:hypothetical protein [Actinomycetota bacterium]